MQFFFDYGPYILTPIHVIVCLILIAVVLLQTGKGADFASALGGGGSQTTFGPRGVENTLSRLTKVAAAVFMVTSLALSIAQSGKPAGVIRDLVGEEGSKTKDDKAKTATTGAAGATSPSTSAPAAGTAVAPVESEPAAVAPASSPVPTP